MKKWSSASVSSTKAFCLIGGAFGILWVFLTPPCQVPDENEHFQRAYQISELNLLAPVENNVVGGYFPDDVVQNISRLKGDIPLHPERKVSLEVFKSANAVQLDSSQTHFHAFANTPAYSPVAYGASSAGLAIARIFGLSLLAGFWIGRLCNLFLCLALTACAIELVPAWSWFFMLTALTPMAVFQRSSFSADALTNALALLVLCMILRFRFVSQWTYQGARKFLFLLASAALPLCKPSYVLIPSLLFFLVPRERIGKSLVKELSLYALVAGVPFAIWLTAIHGLPLQWRGSPHEQILWLTHHPIGWFALVVKTFWNLGHNVPNEWVGVLGWEDTPMPRGFWPLFVLSLIFVMVSESKLPLPFRTRGILLFNATAGVLLIVLPLFVTWTPPGSPYIEGIQGRYFIPLAPLFFLALCPERSIMTRLKSSIPIWSILSATAFLAFASMIIYWRYYQS